MSLKIKNLSVSLGEKQILKDISLEVKPATIHAIMGPNGSGKSTLAQALMGNPNYKIQNPKSKIQINNKNIINYGPDDRAREGLFLAFQNPVAIPGVSVAKLLKTAYQLVKSKNKESRHKVGIRNAVNAHSSQTASGHNPALSVWQFNEKLIEKAKRLGIPSEFLKRSLNEEFSGGEKKKLEMLQAIVLEPKYAIFDEIDTGLDVDALKVTSGGIEELRQKGTGILIITHYQRIL
ncbi:ATP-binding cassette domain-containing protein, partial [Candidatus Gottesmanbacteria bacterium]|nr:ATP-binding cassette domain-containing protein [Candidatus Gottesmanbacteria bacterium]